VQDEAVVFGRGGVVDDVGAEDLRSEERMAFKVVVSAGVW